ncbi:MAG: ORF6N domain-containing protein [Patescibacteria group bacterium]|nr:ORF6N domain-containing protein [Patescibacteria group bacterium]
MVANSYIENRIFSVRGSKVMFDMDLAELYGVPTKRLIEQVKRNIRRFPDDFMFQLSQEEFKNWRSQFATSNSGMKMGLRRPPYVFTEHGAVMLASVLNSEAAVAASIQVVRAFIRFRSILGAHKELARKLVDLEKKYDGKFLVVFRALEKLMSPPEEPKEPIGFRLCPDP